MLLDQLMDQQKRTDGNAKLMVVRDQFDHLIPKMQIDRSSEPPPKFLDYAARVALDVPRMLARRDRAIKNSADFLS
jgi:hypothetical protein